MESFREAIWEHVPMDARPERGTQRMAFLRAGVAAGDRVLDLGCGDGVFAEALVAAGTEVAAADVAALAVTRAMVRLGDRADVRLIAEDGELPWEEDAFDVVWAGEVLEHVVDVVLLLAQVRRVLRWGGTLLVTTPAHGRLRTAALALRGRAFDAHFDPRADHLRFFTARTLRDVLLDAGFPDVRIEQVGGVPLWRTALHAVAR